MWFWVKTKCSNEEIGRFTSAFHHVVHSCPHNGLQSSPFYRSGSSNLENTIFAHEGLKLEIVQAHFNTNISSKHLYFENSYCTLAAILNTFPVNSRHGASDDKWSPFLTPKMQAHEFVGPCPHRDNRIEFCKFCLIKTGFRLGEPVYLMKVFRLFTLKWIFWCWECEHSRWIKVAANFRVFIPFLFFSLLLCTFLESAVGFKIKFCTHTILFGILNNDGATWPHQRPVILETTITKQ